jgi:8-oxo-dGTP pyrophosphatase MutT (NUDIX family)
MRSMWASADRASAPLGQVVEALKDESSGESFSDPGTTAGVLVLIQCLPQGCGEPFLLLNKRSPWVRQPGDLCCPGGRVNRGLDPFLGLLLALPGFLLARSRGWKARAMRPFLWRRHLATYWACCLRESWEEMGLRPWGVEFLGLLPLYQLRLFQRKILPLVGWLTGEGHFRPNWEVERIVPIAISSLLNGGSYALYDLRDNDVGTDSSWREEGLFPCFIHEDELGQEVLWGATYHIVLTLLQRIYGFQPPPPQTLPVIQGRLARSYMTGRQSRFDR